MLANLPYAAEMGPHGSNRYDGWSANNKPPSLTDEHSQGVPSQYHLLFYLSHPPTHPSVNHPSLTSSISRCPPITKTYYHPPLEKHVNTLLHKTTITARAGERAIS
jgi:hypothetical protein